MLWKSVPLKTRVAIVAGILGISFAGSAFYNKVAEPDDYLGCLEQNMKEAKTEAAARAISSACYRKYGSQTREISVVSGVSSYLGKKDSGSNTTTAYRPRPKGDSKNLFEEFADLDDQGKPIIKETR